MTDTQKKFYHSLIGTYPAPAKLLRVGCGTGLFEHLLAREGKDVTGIETSPEVLRSANLRRRNQLMSIRFFQMSYLDMTRFLGKGFYNIISSLDNRIVFIHEKTLMRKFFFDCRLLLAEGGALVLNLYNYMVFNAVPLARLPTRESLRARLFSEIWTNDDGRKVLTQNVETGTGKMLPIMQDAPIYSLQPAEIEQFASEAGFSSVEFYADYERQPFRGTEESLVAVVR